MGDLLFFLAASVSISGAGSAALVDACLYLPLGVLLSVCVIEVFSGGRKGVDLDKAVVVLLVTGSVLFFLGAFLTFSQTSSLGQEIAVKASGAGILLGIVSAVAAMLKQQCYLQKLLAAAKARTQRRRTTGANGLWPVLYAFMLLIVIGAGVAATVLRPDLQITQAGAPADEQLLVNEETSTPTASEPESSSPVGRPEPFPSDAPEVAMVDDEPEMEEPVPEMEEPELAVEELEPEMEVEPEIEEVVEAEVTLVSAKVDPKALGTFKGSVVPMMKDRCLSCHGSDKQKGGLRLDTPEWIRKGGNSGPVVVAFNPDKSYLYTSTVLPGDDPDIMPAKGKPLTSAQTSAIRRWIRGGAPMGDGKDQEAAEAAVAANQSKGSSSAGKSDLSGSLAEALEKAHIQSKPIEGGLFEIDCSLTRNYPEVELDLSVLAPIADKIHTLDLSKTKIKDEGLAPVATFTGLKRLLLSRTTVGDDALAHVSGLKDLEILNLYGTNVSDSGLDYLTELTKLQKLYLWNSKATSAGGDRLKQSIPNLEVNVGQ